MDYKVSLYSPVEIEIGGQKYKVKKLHRASFKALSDYEKQEKDVTGAFEKVELLYDQAQMFVDAPQAVIDELSPQQITELIQMLGKILFQKEETPEGADEKNALKPGDDPAA